MKTNEILSYIENECKKNNIAPSIVFGELAKEGLKQYNNGELCEGAILPVFGSGEKCCNGIEHIIKDLETYKDCRDDAICIVDNVLNVQDDDLLLFDYGDNVPEGCAGGVTQIGDAYIVHVTAMRSNKRTIFVDCEGCSYCRYVFFSYRYAEEWGDVAEPIRKQIEEQEAEEMAGEMMKSAKALETYNDRCKKYLPLMEEVKESDTPRKQKATQRKNALHILGVCFPGVKFSVKYSVCWSHSLCIEWEDGPTEEQVIKSDITLLQRSQIRFDGMTDSTEIEQFENAEFAKKYALLINEIELSRAATEETKAEIMADIKSVWSEKGFGEYLNQEQTREINSIFLTDIYATCGANTEMVFDNIFGKLSFA